jgi:hypothetical protein
MYEAEGRYPLRSIPAALKHLSLHHDTLPISDRGAVLHAIRAVGGSDADVQDAPDGPLTLAAAQALSRRCHALQSVAGHAIKIIRDKVIAHHELVDSAALPKTTYAEIDELIEFATELVVMVGHGYTGNAYRTDDGEYYLTSDAERSTWSLKRLLAAAGVTLSDVSPGNEQG